MSKKHNDYWSKRSDDIMHYVDGTDIDMFAELQKVYVEQSAELQRDLFAFVTKYADDNKMSYSDALQRLRGVDLSNYQANAKKYRKQAEKDPELLKRLNEQYAGSKVTRLDALNLEMTYKVGVMQGVLETSFENYLKSTASYVYRKVLGGNSGTLNEPALKELINTPFNGRNYSQQLWGNTDDLANDLRNVLKRGFIRGDDVRSMASELAKKYNVARSRAQTLIRTDGTAIINRATIERYKNAGLKYYRISVHLDNRTSDICREIAREDKRYSLDEFEVGVTAPPFHYNCRSAVIPDEAELDEKSFNNIKNVNRFELNLDNMQMFAINDKQAILSKIASGEIDAELFYSRKFAFDETFRNGVQTPIQKVYNRSDAYYHIINRHAEDWFNDKGINQIVKTLQTPAEIYETTDFFGNKAKSYFRKSDGKELMVVVRNGIITAYKPNTNYAKKQKGKGVKIYDSKN